MIKLLPCPFCGGEPELNIFYDDDTINVPNPICDVEFIVVRCASCGISKEKLTVESASTWWNGRHAQQQPAIDRLRRCITMAMGCLDPESENPDERLAWLRLSDGMEGREPRAEIADGGGK